MSDGPGLLQQVFNERSALLAFFGALGGAVRSATLKTTWREGLRVVFIGTATAFGVGILGPIIIRPYVGDLPTELSATIGVLCGSAFIIGLLAVTIIERWLDPEPEGDTDAEI